MIGVYCQWHKDGLDNGGIAGGGSGFVVFLSHSELQSPWDDIGFFNQVRVSGTQAGGRSALPIVISPPAGKAVVNFDCAGVSVAGINGCKTPLLRCVCNLSVIAQSVVNGCPAFHCAIGSDCTYMIGPHACRKKLACGWCALQLRMNAPAQQGMAGVDCTNIAFSRIDSQKAFVGHGVLNIRTVTPAQQSLVSANAAAVIVCNTDGKKLA